MTTERVPDLPELPDLLLEKLHLGELPPDVAAAVRARLEREPGGVERLTALARDDEAFAVPRRPAPPETPSRLLRFGVPSLVAAIAAVLIVTRLPAPDAESDVRAKGGATSKPALIIYRQVPPSSADAQPTFQVLGDGATARPGDVLQLAYVAVGRRVGAILSVDGRGQTTTHLPATELAQGAEVRLPAAFRLDDAPGFERFVFMTTAPGTGVLEVTTFTVNKP